MRSILKRASVVCQSESEPRKKISMDTEQDPPPHPSVSYGGSPASGVHERSPTARRTYDTIPSVTASTDQDTSTGDVTREVRTGLTKDVTRTSSSDDNGEDVAMREDNAGENRAEDPYGSDSRRRITAKKDHNT